MEPTWPRRVGIFMTLVLGVMVVLTIVAAKYVPGEVKPQIIGKVAVGETVTAGVGSLQVPPDCRVGFTWWVGTHSTRAYEPTSDSSGFTITPEMAGARLYLWANYYGPDCYYSGWSRPSKVEAFEDIPVNPDVEIKMVQPPRIVGDPRPGGVLRVVPGQFEPADVRLTYCWKSNAEGLRDEPQDWDAASVAEYCEEFPVGSEVTVPAAWARSWVGLIVTAAYQDYAPLSKVYDQVLIEGS